MYWGGGSQRNDCGTPVKCIVYLNGQWFSYKDANVSVFDHGFLYGDSIFETFRTYDGKPFLFGAHIDRLFRSADRISLDIPFTKKFLKQTVLKTATHFWEKYTYSDLYIRIIISRGIGDIGFDPALCKKPTSIIIVKTFSPLPDHLYKKGVRMTISSIIRNHPLALDPNIRSGNYLNNILAYIDAKKEKSYDAIMLNHKGWIAEATNSNVFMVRDNKVYTPALSHGLLKGLTREFIMRVADQLKIKIKEANITSKALISADECFISSSLREILPVTECVYRGEKCSIGTGKPGQVTQKLMRCFWT